MTTKQKMKIISVNMEPDDNNSTTPYNDISEITIA